MLDYLGIINIIFFAAVVYVLARKSSNFTLRKNTISQLACWERTGLAFNITLLLFSINQTVFALMICRSLEGG